MNEKDAERALRTIWKIIADRMDEGKRPTKDDMLRIMGWCAGGLGVEVGRGPPPANDDLKDE